MSIKALMRKARLAAEQLMTQQVTVERRSSRISEDGVEVFDSTPVFTGRCKVNTYEPFESNRDSAGAPTVEQRYMLHLPVSSIGAVEVGDIAVIDGRQRPLRIASLLEKTHQTAVRCGCEELVSEPVE